MSSIHPPITILPPTNGLVADVPQQELGLRELSEVENFLLRDGGFTLRPGLLAFADDIDERPMAYVFYKNNSDTVFIVMATDDAWWHYNAGTDAWTDISDVITLTATAVDHTTFRVFQTAGATTLLGTNGVDAPNKWTGTGNMAVIGGSPPKARCMAINNNIVMLGHLTSGGTTSPVAIDVSDPLDPDNGWGTFVTLLADTPGHIVSMNELGSLLTAIYKDDAIYLAAASGGVDPFTYELKYADIDGPASEKCVVPIAEGQQVVLTNQGDVKIFDGNSYIGFHKAYGSTRETILKRVRETANFTNFSRSWGVYKQRRREVWFFYPEQNASDPNIGIVLNLNTGGVWPIRYGGHSLSAGLDLDIPTGPTIGELVGTVGEQPAGQTIGEYGSSVSRLILGDIGGQSYQDTGDDDAGTVIDFTAETGLQGLEAPNNIKTLHEIQYLFKKAAMSQNVSTQVGVMNYGEDRALGTARTIDVGADGPYIKGYRQDGRLFSLRLSGSASYPITWRGAFVHASLRGQR